MTAIEHRLPGVGLLVAVCMLGGCATIMDSPQPAERLLYDFSDPHLPGSVWHSVPVRSHDRLQAQRVASDRGPALRLAYAFGDAAPAAIGYRLPLHGLDASGFDHLLMWVKAEDAAADGQGLAVEFKRPAPDRPDMQQKGSYTVRVHGSGWQPLSIPLRRMLGLRDWRYVEELVLLVHSVRDGLQGAVLVDDLRLVRTGEPGPGLDDPVATPLKDAWERAHGGKPALLRHLRARLQGWPGPAPARQSLLALDDRALLQRVALDTWRGLDALVDREHGLPLDNLRLGTGPDFMTGARIGDYTNVTNIGLHFMALVGAEALGFITRDTLLTQARRLLTVVQQLEQAHGFYYNYYDATTLERTTHFISFVDSAWLTAGLIVLRNAVPALAPACSAIIDQGNYAFFYDSSERLMRHGYYTHMQAASEYHYGALYAESRLGSAIAIGKGDVPAVHWFTLARTFPQAFAWQTQTPVAVHSKTVGPYGFTGGLYRWGGLSYVPSWGGSMFEALMPALVLNEARYAPRSLGHNDAVHVMLHQRFAREVLGYKVWGMSPSATPQGDGYGEYGVRWLGMLGYGTGAVTAHASALALLVDPRAATANLRALIRRYDSYGDFGFYDALDPVSGQVAHKYLALNQAMLFLALVNHLRGGVLQTHFAHDPIMRQVLPLLGREDFWQ